MHRALASEVNVLTHMLNEISSQDRRARDFTCGVLREAIRETIACFPVYRTYVDERGNVNDRDRRYIQQAIDRAKRRNAIIGSGSLRLPAENLVCSKGNDDGATMLRLPQATILHAEVSAAHRAGNGERAGGHRLLRLYPVRLGQ